MVRQTQKAHLAYDSYGVLRLEYDDALKGEYGGLVVEPDARMMPVDPVEEKLQSRTLDSVLKMQ